MAKNWTIFITRSIPSPGIELLESAGMEVHVWDNFNPPSKEQLIDNAKKAHALVTMVTDTIDKKFLNKCTHLKCITNYGVGHNNIDTARATELGITVGNTPDVLSQATAELAIGLLFSLARHIPESRDYAKDGKWSSWHPKLFLGTELKGKTVGIVGKGRIGKSFEKMAKGIGLKTLYHNRSKLDDNWRPLETLVSECDIISIHCDLNKETYKLFNKSLFSKFKKGALLINTARGEIIDQNDLMWALEQKVLAGAALDVTDPEPLGSDHPLFKKDNVIITPHIGSATYKARNEMSAICAQNILNAYNQVPLKGFVNPEVWQKNKKA